ncbi:vascular endothelial growth factor [European chub iridovirus]|nr:vascular endothelial growth factor [European chub iridovirus]
MKLCCISMCFLATIVYNIYCLPILETIKLSMCKPRDTKIDVYKLDRADVSKIYTPSCVYVKRCGGCCNGDQFTCEASHKNITELTLFQTNALLMSKHNRVAPITPIIFKVVEHTACKCVSTIRHLIRPLIR